MLQKWVVENMPFIIESVHNDNKTDYVIYVPINAPKEAILKRIYLV